MAILPSDSTDRGWLPQLSASALTFLTFTHAQNTPLILAHQQRQVCVTAISIQKAVKRLASLALMLHLSSCELDVADARE